MSDACLHLLHRCKYPSLYHTHTAHPLESGVLLPALSILSFGYCILAFPAAPLLPFCSLFWTVLRLAKVDPLQSGKAELRSVLIVAFPFVLYCCACACSEANVSLSCVFCRNCTDLCALRYCNPCPEVSVCLAYLGLRLGSTKPLTGNFVKLSEEVLAPLTLRGLVERRLRQA